MNFIRNERDLGVVVLDRQHNTIDSINEKQEKISCSSNFFLAADFCPDQFISNLCEAKILNADLTLNDSYLSLKLPALNKEILIEIIKMLKKQIVIKARDNSFSIEITLFDLISYLNSRRNPKLQIKNIEIVGGMVFWLLKGYLKKVFEEVGLKDLEGLLSEDLLKSWEVLPSDIDIRLFVPNVQEEKELRELNSIVEDFITLKFSQKNVPFNIRKNWVNQQAFSKFKTIFDAANHYSTIAFNDSLGGPSVDILFIKQLKRLSLFVQDALRLKINHLIEGLVKYNGSAENLITAIENGSFQCDEIIPESDVENGLLTLIYRIAGIVNAYDPEGINEAGWALLMSALTKGKRCLDTELEPILIKKIGNSAIFWLDKTFKNHHQNNSLAAFALTFNGCNSLKKYEDVSALWKGMRHHFSNCENILVKEIDRFISAGANIEEISAFLQVKAFLQLCTSNSHEYFQAQLVLHNQKPTIRINIEGHYLLLPFDPENALQTIIESKHNINEELLFPEFFFQVENSVLDRNFRQLKLDWDKLNNLAKILIEKENSLGFYVIIASALYNGCENIFNQLLDYFPKILPSSNLTKNLLNLRLDPKDLKVIHAYNSISSENLTPEIKWARALILSGRDNLVRKGYALALKENPKIDVNILLIIDLAKTRPDLAINLMLSLKKKEVNRPALLWMKICQACQKRKQINRIIDLPVLLKGIQWIFSKEEKFNSQIAAKEFIDGLNWVFHELIELKEYKQCVELLKILELDSFKPHLVKLVEELIKKQFLILFNNAIESKEGLELVRDLLFDGKIFKLFNSKESIEICTLFSQKALSIDCKAFEKDIIALLKIFDNDITNNDYLFQFFDLFKIMEAPPWHLLMEAVYKNKNRNLQFKAWEVLQYLENNNKLINQPEERKICFLYCLKGLNEFPSDNILNIFNNFSEVLKLFDTEERREFICLICNAIDKSFKKSNYQLDFYNEIFSTINQNLCTELIRSDPFLDRFIDLFAIEIALKVKDQTVFERNCKNLFFFIEKSSDLKDCEKHILSIAQELKNFAINSEENLTHWVDKLLTAIREKSDLKLALNLIIVLGHHASPYVIRHVCLLFEDCLNRVDINEYKEKICDSTAYFLVLSKAIENHFSQICVIINRCFDPSKLKSFFNKKTIANLLFKFIEKRYSLYKDFGYESSIELIMIIKWIRSHFFVLSEDTQCQKKVISIALESMVRLGRLQKKIPLDVFRMFERDVIKNAYFQLGGKNITNIECFISNPNLNINEYSLKNNLSKNEKEILLKVEKYVNDYHMQFLKLLFYVPFNDIEEKMATLSFVKTILDFFVLCKNIHKESIFKEILELYCFFPFSNEQSDHYKIHLSNASNLLNRLCFDNANKELVEFVSALKLHVDKNFYIPGKNNSSLAAKMYENMIQKCLNTESKDSNRSSSKFSNKSSEIEGQEFEIENPINRDKERIREAIFMLQNGKTKVLDNHPEVVLKLYKLIIKKINETSKNLEEKLLLLNELQEGFNNTYIMSENYFIKFKKDDHWSKITKEISVLIFHAILERSQKEDKTLAIKKINMAYDFLSKALLMNCFNENYLTYLDLINFLIKEIIAFDNDIEFLQTISVKILSIISFQNCKINYTLEEKNARAKIFYNQISLLVKTKKLRNILIAKELVQRSFEAKKSQIFDDILFKKADQLIKKATKSLPKESFLSESTFFSFSNNMEALFFILDFSLGKENLLTDERFRILNFMLDEFTKNEKTWDSARKLLLTLVSLVKISQFREKIESLFLKWLEIIYKNADIEVALTEFNVISKLQIFNNSTDNINEEYLNYIYLLLCKYYKYIEDIIEKKDLSKNDLIELTFINDIHEILGPLEKKLQNELYCERALNFGNKIRKQFASIIEKHISQLIEHGDYEIAKRKLKGVQGLWLNKKIILNLMSSLLKKCYNKKLYGLCASLFLSLEKFLFQNTSFLIIKSSFYHILSLIVYETRPKNKKYNAHLILSLLLSRTGKKLIKEEPMIMVPFLSFLIKKTINIKSTSFHLKLNYIKKMMEDSGFKPSNETFCKRENIFDKVHQFSLQNVISAKKLGKLFKKLLWLNDEKLCIDVWGILKNYFHHEIQWEGTIEDRTKCFIVGIKILNKYFPEKVIYFLDNFIDFLKLEEVNLCMLKLFFQSFEGSLKDNSNYNYYIAKVNNAKEMSIPHLISKKTNALDMYNYLISVDLSIAKIACRINFPLDFSSSYFFLKKLNLETLTSKHICKVYQLLNLMIEQIISSKDQYFNKVNKDDLLKNIFDISDHLYQKLKNGNEYFSLIKNLIKVNDVSAIKHALNLISYKICHENPEFNSEFTKIAFELINLAIKEHLFPCFNEIAKCLKNFEYSHWCSSKELANAWKLFVVSHYEYLEKNWITMNPKEVKNFKLKIFCALLSSLNGIFGDNETSEFVMNKHYSLMFDFFHHDLLAFKTMFLAFWHLIEQHIFLRIHGEVDFYELNNDLKNNEINFLDTSRECFDILNEFEKNETRNFLTPYVVKIVKKLKLTFYKKLLKISCKKIKKESLDGNEIKRERIFITNVIFNDLVEFMNSPYDAEVYKLLNDVILEYVLLPFPEFCSEEFEKHLEKTVELINKAQEVGLLNKFPKEFYKYKCLFKILNKVSLEKTFSHEEEKEIILELFKKIINKPFYSSYKLCFNILYNGKNDILYNDSDLFLKCYMLLIDAIEKKSDPDMELTFLHNRLFHNGDICKNPLLKKNRTKDWKLTSAIISQRFFKALLNYKNNGKSSIVFSGNIITSSTPPISMPILFLFDAMSKKQFSDNYKIYLHTIRKLIDYSLKNLKSSKEIKFLTTIIAELLIIMDEPLSEEIKKDRMLLLDGWFRNIASTKQVENYSILDEEMSHKNVLKIYEGYKDVLEETKIFLKNSLA